MRIIPNPPPKVIPDWRVVGSDPKVKLSPQSRPVKVGTPLRVTSHGWTAAAAFQPYQLISGGVGAGGDYVRAFLYVIVDVGDPDLPPGVYLKVTDVDEHGNVKLEIDRGPNKKEKDKAQAESGATAQRDEELLGPHFSLGGGMVLLTT